MNIFYLNEFYSPLTCLFTKEIKVIHIALF